MDSASGEERRTPKMWYPTDRTRTQQPGAGGQAWGLDIKCMKPQTQQKPLSGSMGSPLASVGCSRCVPQGARREPENGPREEDSGRSSARGSRSLWKEETRGRCLRVSQGQPGAAHSSQTHVGPRPPQPEDPGQLLLRPRCGRAPGSGGNQRITAELKGGRGWPSKSSSHVIGDSNELVAKFMEFDRNDHRCHVDVPSQAVSCVSIRSALHLKPW